MVAEEKGEKRMRDVFFERNASKKKRAKRVVSSAEKKKNLLHFSFSSL